MKDTDAATPTPKRTPQGVRLLRTLAGHGASVTSVAFDSQGKTLASASIDGSVRLWEVPSGRPIGTVITAAAGRPVWSVAFDPIAGTMAAGGSGDEVTIWEPLTGKLLHRLDAHGAAAASVAIHPYNGMLASAGADDGVRLWNGRSGRLLRTLGGNGGRNDWVWCLAFSPQGSVLASDSGDPDPTVKLWEPQSGKLLGALERHGGRPCSVAFDPRGATLASANVDKTVNLWSVPSGKLLRTLEAHTEGVEGVAFSPDGGLLASKSHDHTIRLWHCATWETVAVIPEPNSAVHVIPALAFHPTLPILATAGSDLGAHPSRVVHLWELSFDTLLGKGAQRPAAVPAVQHTTGKIVLLGDHSVGKSALGIRLIHGRFEKQESTHGQQFWVFPALGKRRADGTDCEAILWDFAGQPDYRLVHALFIDNADLALVLFDASDLRDPLHGVGFWLKQLQVGQRRCPVILVAAQTDRGTCSLTPDELATFCRTHGIVGPIETSALKDVGIDALAERMKALIPWDEKVATVTTATFKRIKDYVLGLKGAKQDGRTIVTAADLRRLLEATDAKWRFSGAELLTAVGHLENYGYVKVLRTSTGEPRILLQPERLNNLASSMVLEARRNPKGLGALEEKRLLAAGYAFPELSDLPPEARDALLDSAALLFLEHNVCFRETDPLRMEPFLVFPELINLKRPAEDEAATVDGMAYTVTGPTENVFASLVVLLGYTHTFTRTAQWQNNARYEVGEGLVCGFRQEAERDGELDFVLCFGPQVGQPVRTVFQGLFESFLARRNLTVTRFTPVRCTNAICGQPLDRSVLRQKLKEGKTFTFCNDCGTRLPLPGVAEPIQLTRELQTEVEAQRSAADQRTRFEQAVFRLRAYVTEQKINPPECFISYAWGRPEHESWVEKRLAADLQKAGLGVLLDRWHNAQIGASVARFAERLATVDRIVVVGTPLYRQKYENKTAGTAFVVAGEVDLINNRLLGTERQKLSVLPLLLDGEAGTSLPPLLQGRVHADFRGPGYFSTAFDLMLSLYELPPNDLAVADLRESLRG